MNTTIKIPKQMNNREFTQKVLKAGIVLQNDGYGYKFVAAFDKTYCVHNDESCAKMTPQEWIRTHEDFRND